MGPVIRFVEASRSDTMLAMVLRQRVTPRRRPPALAAAVPLVVLLACCSRPQAPREAAKPATPAPAASPAPLLLPPPPLGRAELLDAARASADAYASGSDYPKQVIDLIGRRFSIRLPFGCGIPASGAEVGAYELNPKNRTVTVTAQPQVWTAAPWMQPILFGQTDVDVVEGFWIQRPWTTSDACPPQPVEPANVAPPPAQKPAPDGKAAGKTPSATAAPALGPDLPAAPWPSPETLGLARVFHKGDSRLKRHTRHPYQAVLKLSDSRVPQDHRFWLVLEGRIADVTDGKGKGQPTGCFADDPYRRPLCVIGVDVDHVSIEAMDTGDVLADWPD